MGEADTHGDSAVKGPEAGGGALTCWVPAGRGAPHMLGPPSLLSIMKIHKHPEKSPSLSVPPSHCFLDHRALSGRKAHGSLAGRGGWKLRVRTCL